MRTIKFRGKCTDDGMWRHGDLLHADNLIWINDNGLHCTVDEKTVGEFTGLHDKNGEEVFEGDILRVKEYKNLCWDLSKNREERDEMMRTFALDDLKGELDKEYISAVAVEESMYCLSSNGDYNDMCLSCLFGPMNGSLPIFDFEVVGNIHDNPELLSKSKHA